MDTKEKNPVQRRRRTAPGKTAQKRRPARTGTRSAAASRSAETSQRRRRKAATQQTQQRRGKHGHKHLDPQTPDHLSLLFIFLAVEGVELIPKDHQHGGDGAQLDDHLKHFVEFVGHLQLEHLVKQDQMTRGRDGQPLGNALDDAE